MLLKEVLPPTAKQIAEKDANVQHMKEDLRHPVPDLMQQPWTQSPPCNQKMTMEVNMFLCETSKAADGLCICACMYTTPNDA